MDLETIRKYCLEKKSSGESFPFGESTLVFKVSGKIFLLMSLDSLPLRINLKCDPDKAEELREVYSSVIPAFHMNKKHWNTIILDGQVSAKLIREMIDDSYALVVQSLPPQRKKKTWEILMVIPVTFYFFLYYIGYKVPDGFSFFQNITDMGSRNL